MLIGPLCLAAYALPATERVTTLWFRALVAVLAVRFAWTIAFVLFSLQALPHIGASGSPPTVGDTNLLLGLATGAAAMMLGLPLVSCRDRGLGPRAVSGAASNPAARMNERGLVEVPENAVRDEPLAFGLSAPQLVLCGAAVGIGALLNLVPLWLPVKIVLLLVVVAPVVLAAILPIRGEPAYRWLVRAIRYLRGRGPGTRVLLPVPGKSEISGDVQPVGSAVDEGAGADTAIDGLGAAARAGGRWERFGSACPGAGTDGGAGRPAAGRRTRWRRGPGARRPDRHGAAATPRRDPACPARAARRRGPGLRRRGGQDDARGRDRDARRRAGPDPLDRGGGAGGPGPRPRRRADRERRRPAAGPRPGRPVGGLEPSDLARSVRDRRARQGDPLAGRRPDPAAASPTRRARRPGRSWSAGLRRCSRPTRCSRAPSAPGTTCWSPTSGASSRTATAS